MRIYTKLQYSWDGIKYALDKAEYFEYNGEVALLCGPSAQQTQLASQQASFMTQLQTQASQAFGTASAVLNSLVSTFTPTIQAGPNQQGMSPAELAARNAAVIQNAGIAAKNAKAAVGNEEAAVGGGNVSLPSGAKIGADLSVAENAANQTSTGLNQVEQENYTLGRENYDNAVKGLEGSTSVLNPVTSADNAASTSGTVASNQANANEQASTSWMAPVASVLGDVASVATGGIIKGIQNPTSNATQQQPIPNYGANQGNQGNIGEGTVEEAA
jgi:hypothetical protein